MQRQQQQQLQQKRRYQILSTVCLIQKTDLQISVISLTLSGTYYLFDLKCLETGFLGRSIQICDTNFESRHIRFVVLDFENLKTLTTNSDSATRKQVQRSFQMGFSSLEI